MSKRWKLKTNSSNILLVLITLILIKAEWVTGADDTSPETVNSEENWELPGETQLFIGNDEISQHYFQPSTNNNSLILEEVRNCLDNFQLMTCLKMLLLSRINEVVKYVEEPDVVGKDLHFLNGFMIFKRKNESNAIEFSENSHVLGLDEEIAFKVLKIFRNRFLLINLLPKFKIEMEPNPKVNDTDFICFKYKFRKEPELEDGMDENAIEGRGKKKGGMGMMMLVPPMIMLGLMPFTLASLKAMVMNAVMINMMALNGAIFMTIRNLVFGPRRGENVKYVNYGYSKDRQTQSKKPVLIIHSPAAFVKQPPVKSNRNPDQFHEKPNYQAENYFPTGDSSLSHHQHHPESKDYYLIQQDYANDDSNYEYHNRRSAQRKDQGNTFKRFNHAGRLKSRVTSNYNLKNSFPTNPHQRKLAKSEIKIQTDQNRKFGLNESSPGLVYSNLAGKKAGGNFNYSRQIEKSSRMF